MSLLRDDERRVVVQVRSDVPPKGWPARLNYEFVRGCAALMAPRTIAIDDAIGECSTVQLVILRAGLDARAWRMNELAGTIAFEVDHPATQVDKRERLGQRAAAAKDVRFVATDSPSRGWTKRWTGRGIALMCRPRGCGKASCLT